MSIVNTKPTKIKLLVVEKVYLLRRRKKESLFLEDNEKEKQEE
jgi:hypothetical protein